MTLLLKKIKIYGCAAYVNMYTPRKCKGLNLYYKYVVSVSPLCIYFWIQFFHTRNLIYEYNMSSLNKRGLRNCCIHKVQPTGIFKQ